MKPAFQTVSNDSWIPHVLCETCRDQTSGWQLDGPNDAIPYGQQVQRILREVQLTALKGCHLCSILCAHFYPVHDAEDVVTASDTRYIECEFLQHHSAPGNEKYGLRMGLKSLAEPDSNGKHETYLFINTKPPVNSHGANPASLSVSTGSDSMFNLAKSWLATCAAEHQNCNTYAAALKPATGRQPLVPNYFVEITVPDTISNGIQGYTARLIDSAVFSGTIPKWVTLSHCWGPRPIFSTTSDNLESNLVQLPLEKLPKTFVDAIIITSRLGHRYLWIDSLCIIQDSLDHWLQESALMGAVYNFSSFTIAASGATDGTVGCFRRRNPLGFHPLRIDLPTKSLWITEQTPERKLNWSATAPDTTCNTGYIPVEPLNRRGWVLQERLLSPRTILYGSHNLFFECALTSGSDANTMLKDIGTTVTEKMMLERLTVEAPRGNLVDVGYTPEWGLFHLQWWGIIKSYSGCELTRATDKLVAINGIVKMVEGITGFGNVAGLWKECFLSDLLWTVEKTGVVRQKDWNYRAPTWSWASTDSVVMNPLDQGWDEREWRTELVAVEAETAINGQVQRAWARVRGPMRMVEWEKERNSYPVSGAGRYKISWVTGEEPAQGKEWLWFVPDAVMKDGAHEELWVLQVMKCTSESPESWMNYGIVVGKNGKKNDHGEEEWIRVGSIRQCRWAPTKDTLFQGSEIETREIYLI